MKILIFIACALTIATMAYTADVQNAQKFYTDLTTCANELGLPNEFSLHVVKCMFEKNSLIDEQGAMKKDEILRYFGYMTSDQRQLQRIASCIDHAETRVEENNDQKTLAAIQCSLFKLAILEKQY